MHNTIDPKEIENFTRMAESWWDPHGKFKPLHDMNPVRLDYIIRTITAQHGRSMAQHGCLSGLSIIDIGCGGGLISEPMARLGAHVMGIDAGEKNIAVAKLHAEQSGLVIDYRFTSAEALLHDQTTASKAPQFDVVLALEIVEHVADVDAFIATISRLVVPGGLIFVSTINRTIKSYLMAIVGAEYVLRWLPRGTHQWNKFLKPHELVDRFRLHQLDTTALMGMVFHPLHQSWHLDPHDTSVNYMLVAQAAPTPVTQTS